MYTDSYGVAINLKFGVSLVGATGASVTLKDPDGSVLDKTTTVSIIDEKNGIVQYITEVGDFTRTGKYSLQATILFGATKRLKSNILKFDVEQAL